MIVALCLQTSLLLHPLYLDPEPPELRSLRAIVLPAGTEEVAEASRELAARLRLRLDAGEPFAQLARAHSSDASAPYGGALGSFAHGMLGEELDRFLFEAEVGQLSPPIEAGGVLHLLQRIDTYAALRQILIPGQGPESLERANAILAELRAGADFAALAHEHSADPASQARGGDYAILERGPRDRLIKAIAFQTEVGALAGPVRTSLGHHVLWRVPVAELDPALRQSYWMRFRAILIRHLSAEDPPVGAPSLGEAQAFAVEISRRWSAGEEFPALARELNEDPGGRERAGDLGWVHRRTPKLPSYLGRAFVLQPGQLSSPFQTTAGLVLVYRER